jgi:hypothetical protein
MTFLDGAVYLFRDVIVISFVLSAIEVEDEAELIKDSPRFTRYGKMGTCGIFDTISQYAYCVIRFTASTSW